MGSVLEKTEYLKRTIDLLDGWYAEEDTTRNKIEKLDKGLTDLHNFNIKEGVRNNFYNDYQAAAKTLFDKIIPGNNFEEKMQNLTDMVLFFLTPYLFYAGTIVIEDEIGQYNIRPYSTSNAIIFPKMNAIYGGNSNNESYCINLVYSTNPAYYSSTLEYVDMRNISGAALYFCLGYTVPSTLRTQEVFNLARSTCYASSSNYLKYLFGRGLILGRHCVYCSSIWLRSSLNSPSRVVKCMPEFEGTIYLSKISMSAETMVDLFNNLKDLNGTNLSYTFNIGTTNKAKLTSEQLSIATKKGWDIT